MNRYFATATAAAILGATACAPEPVDIAPELRIGALPAVARAPADNPTTPEKVELGRLLFWDPILSGPQDVACATCHHPDHGYADDRALSLGVGGRGLGAGRLGGSLATRNSPTVLNAAFNGIDAAGDHHPDTAPMFWDNRAETLERQALMAIRAAIEMRGVDIAEDDILDTLSQRLATVPAYVAAFEVAFGPDAITGANVARAIAAFERTLVTPDSPFDRYAAGDADALTSLELRGLINFLDVGCADCHGGPMFADYELHVLGTPESALLSEPDRGDGTFAFRTPTLRNLALTAPYMHNGTLGTLEDVMDFYFLPDAGSQNAHISDAELAGEFTGLTMSNDQINSITAFLGALNDESFDREVPADVPSGLRPGGALD